MNEEDKKGIVYVLTNPAMPDLVKIGRVENNESISLKKRIYSLYAGNTSIPYLFEYYYAVEVNDVKVTEKRLHKLFDDKRVNPKREFFQVTPERVVVAMQLTDGKEVSPDSRADDIDPKDTPTIEEVKALEHAHQQVNKKRSNFRFSDVGIKEGEELTFSRDEAYKAIVVSDKKVQFEGEECTVSGAARKALYSILGYEWPSVAGTLYWQYNGKTLDEIRKAKEEESVETEE